MLWLALVGYETLASARAPDLPAVQDQVELRLLARGARVARYASGLDPAQREVFLRNLQLDPAQLRVARGQPVPPADLPDGWFRAEAEGAHDPALERREADRDLVLLALGCLWLSLILAGGSLVLVWWLVKGWRLRVEPSTPLPELGRAWLIFVSWQLGATLLVPLIMSLGGPRPSRPLLVAAQLLAYGLGLIVILPRVGPVRPSFRGLRQGVAAFWVASLSVIAIGQLVAWLTGTPLVSRNQALDLFRDADPTAMVWLGLLVVVAGPFFEEYLFRGLLFGGLRTTGREVLATLLAAAVFAVAHRDPAGFLPYLILGVVFARCYAQSGSLFPGMVAHALFNGQTFALLCLLSAG